MSIIIKNIDMPLGCVYEDEDGHTKYCPLCNHEDIPYCTLELIKMPIEGLHLIEIDSRPEWCLLSTFEEPRKGRWIEPKKHGCVTYSSAYAECDQCHSVTFFGATMNFCPNCGTDMRERGDSNS